MRYPMDLETALQRVDKELDVDADRKLSHF